MNNTNMYQLLITATNKEHSNLKTFGYGLNYPIPIVNPVWVGMDKIIAAQASGKLDIMIHNVDPPVLLTHELFAKFTELGYVDEEVVAETPHSEEEEEGTHEGNPEDNSHTEEAHETHEEENHTAGGVSESDVVPPTPTVPATETETAPAAPEPEAEAPSQVDFRVKFVPTGAYRAGKKLFENTDAMGYETGDQDVAILVQVTGLKDTNGNITEDKIKVLAGNPYSADGLRFPVELMMQNDKPFFSKNSKGIITFIAAYSVTDLNGINNMGVALQVNGEQVGYASIYKHAEASDHL
jgi:hypothetical protein